MLFVNCGSVGKPKDGDPRAGFAILELDETGEIRASIERVPYDAKAVAERSPRPAFPASTPRSWSRPHRQEGGSRMKYVLFVCTHNAGRSQMAQALFERDAPDDFRAESAGSDPARQVWPEVVEVMREIGIDLSGNKPKRLIGRDAAARRLGGDDGLRRRVPVRPDPVDDWDIPDPAGRSIDEVREIRDMIDERVHELASEKIDEIRPTRPRTGGGSPSCCRR